MKNYNTRIIATLSLLTAMHIVVSFIYIPILDANRLMFTFFIKAIVGVIASPAFAILFGLTSDILGHIIHPTGSYFIGYTLTSIFSVLIFSIGFYKKNITVFRIIIVRTLVVVICNILLNSLWASILLDNDILYFMSISAIKNLVLLPIEIFVLYIMFKLLLPFLKKYNFSKQN